MSDYLSLNRANWDERAPLHAASPEYAVEEFVTDPHRLSDVVRFDRPRLGDLTGLRAVHLQCHIGTDTLSLARLGARVTGVDFSPASLAQARRLAERTGTEVDYVESDVYAAAARLPTHAFDLVYTGIGALGWLPGIERWADVVAALVAPGGRLHLREGHPMLWALDERIPDDLVVRFPYFETVEPLVWDDADTYVSTATPLTATVTHEWNHGLGEIVTALLERGFTLTALEEHRSIPWEAVPGRMTLGDDGEWRLTEHSERLPLTYTLQAWHPLPEPPSTDERDVLLAVLDGLRASVVATVDGVPEPAVRTPGVPSGTSLLGLVKHLTAVERFYFLGEDARSWPATFRPGSGETAAELVAAYRDVTRRANEVVVGCPDLALPGPRPARRGATPSMRWTLAHVIEETARHAGHADILRERIDGSTGH